MQPSPCPICGIPRVERGRSKDYGDRLQFRCARCGLYEITGTAFALLASRKGDDPDSAWRLSHQIQLRQAHDRWPLIDSYNLEELLAVPLPKPPEQQRRFICWLADKADANGLVPTPMEARLEAEAICGTGGDDGFGHMLRAAIRDSLVTSERHGVVLTNDGWEMVDRLDEPAAGTGAAASTLPVWVAKLPDDALRALLDEVYRGLSAGLVMLPMMGARAAFDRAMFLLVDDPHGGFEAKLRAMVATGHITEQEIGILKPMIDAGSAVAHRGWLPTPAVLSAVIDELEHKLRDWFIRKVSAEAVRSATPPRPQRRPAQ